MSSEREIDILVVGSGGAGLCAAVRAAESGAKVVILEKRRTIGGNTIIAGGRINIANTTTSKIRNRRLARAAFRRST